MSSRTKSTKTKKAKSSSKTATSAKQSTDMKKMLNTLVKDMVVSSDKKGFPKTESNSALVVNELRDELNLLSSSVSARLAQVEVKVSQLGEGIEDIKQMTRERNMKFEADIKKCLESTQNLAEKEKTKRINLVKAIQKKLTEDEEETINKIKKIKEDTDKNIALVNEKVNGQDSDMNKLKQNVDDL